MVHSEGGEFCYVVGQDAADFYVSIGIPKETANKYVGSHWSFKSCRKGSNWTSYITSKEFPEDNNLHVLTEDVAQDVEVPLICGKVKVTMTKSDGGFLFSGESDKMGKIEVREKYCEDGVTKTKTIKGKTFTEFWHRKIHETGSYRFESGTNVEEYFKALDFSPSQCVNFKDYKFLYCVENNFYHMADVFGDRKVVNTYKLDEEGPCVLIDDKDGDCHGRRAVLTKTGNGKYLFVVKHPKGQIEEWNIKFTECGVHMTALEKKSGQTCTINLKRYVEFSGTYKVVDIVGLDDFFHALGITKISSCDFWNSHYIVTEHADGTIHHKQCGKKYSFDFCFKVNNEYSFHHPILNETVTGVAIKGYNTVNQTFKTSKGILKSCTTINNNFAVTCVHIPGTDLSYKIVHQRVCTWK